MADADRGSDPPFPDESTRNVLEADCERCPALVDCRTRISWGNGPADADVFVVGEAPAAGDPEGRAWQGGNHTGLAYTSRHSGRRIRRLFESLGVDAYYTNAVKCFPADGSGESNREPTGEELANCREHLERELETVDPRVVVTTGRHATETLLSFDGAGLDGFVDTVLEPRVLEGFETTVLPLLHPSYQDVWLSRLGLTEETYRERLAEGLRATGVDVE